MIKVSGITACKPIAFEIDGYIPFAFEVQAAESSSPLYWRCHDGDSSLLEVGINEGGTVVSVTLTAIHPRKVYLSDDSFANAGAVDEGLVAFDLRPWGSIELSNFSDRFLDENVPFRLLISPDAARLEFGDGGRAVRYVNCESIFFGISLNGGLVSIEIRGLTLEQVALIREATLG